MMMGFGLIWILLIIVVIAIALGWRPDFLQSRQFNGQSGKTVLDILKERYARGEISREEYDEMRRDLQS
jgi:putative membrane protein